MAAVTQITHFNKINGINGVFAGAVGSEIQIDVGTQTWVINLNGPSTAAQQAFIVVPYATNLISANAAVSSGTVGTGASTTITLTDTAGASLFGTASFTSAGTAGSQVIVYGTMSTAQIAAAGVICIAMASCATAYGATFTITGSKAS